MERDRLIHDYIVETIKDRLRRDYKEITDNISGKNKPVGQHWPDLVLANHGIVLAAVEVETDETLNEQSAERWKAVVQEGTKLILMVPKTATMKVTQLLWDQGIAEKVSVGTYDLNIKMP